MNLKFIHPTRTKRWHHLNLGMAIAWLIFAAWSAAMDFHGGPLVQWGLIVASLYLCLAGIAQELFPDKKPTRIT